MTRRPGLCALALTLALAGAACSDDDGGGAVATTAAPATGGPAAGGDAVTVTAVDYEYEGLPGSVEAGARLALHNGSTGEVHELVAFRLPDGEERSAEELFALGEAEFAELTGGQPAMVLVAPPGEDGFPAVGDGTVADAGRYVVACFIPVGIDPAAYLEAAQASQGGPPELPEGSGPPHLTQGMVGEFTVG
jgi:hypothetical protein